MAGYDAANHLLTFVQSSPPEPAADYVNSLWKEQEHPYAGSAVNSYNDGPNDTGKQLGNFYEMETSSRRVPLDPATNGAALSADDSSARQRGCPVRDCP